MPGTDYKVSLDSSGLHNGLKTFNAAQSIMGSFSSLLRGDLVGAATQAKNSMMALRAAFLANPVIAVATAIAAVASALATVMWRKHTADVEAYTEAMNKLTEAQASYNKTVADIRFNRSSLKQQVDTLEYERNNIAGQNSMLEFSKDPAFSRWLNEDEKKAKSAKIDEQIVINKIRIVELNERIAALQSKIADEANKSKEKAEQEASAKRELVQAAQDKAAKSEQRLVESKPDYTPQMKAVSLEREIRKLQDEQFKALNSGDGLKYYEARNAMLEKEIELQRVRNQLDADKKAKAKAEAEKQANEKKQKAAALSSVKKDEAAYAMSKLSPQEQLAGINLRIKDIMGKKGWEQDATAREEKLALEKRRDDLQEQLRKKKDPSPTKEEPPSRSVTAASEADRFENYYKGGKIKWQPATDDVIRMAGSRHMGFVDSDGVRRMKGSMAGGFSDRLNKSAFARTREEIDAKRAGLTAAAGAKVISRSTGQEQPVDIGMEALNYLKTIADNSAGI